MPFFYQWQSDTGQKCPHIGNKVVCQAEGKAESDRTDMVEILEKTCNCFQSFACASVSKLNQLKTSICVLRPIRGTVEDGETTTKLTLDTFQSSSKSGKADKTTQLVHCCWLLVAQLLCSSKHVNMKGMCRSQPPLKQITNDQLDHLQLNKILNGSIVELIYYGSGISRRLIGLTLLGRRRV